MEQKAEEDAKQRQSHAADRLAERYRQLDEEKASKRIVFVDKVVGVKGKRRGGGGMKGTGGMGKVAARGGVMPGGSVVCHRTAHIQCWVVQHDTD